MTGCGDLRAGEGGYRSGVSPFAELLFGLLPQHIAGSCPRASAAGMLVVRHDRHCALDALHEHRRTAMIRTACHRRADLARSHPSTRPRRRRPRTCGSRRPRSTSHAAAPRSAAAACLAIGRCPSPSWPRPLKPLQVTPSRRGQRAEMEHAPPIAPWTAFRVGGSGKWALDGPGSGCRRAGGRRPHPSTTCCDARHRRRAR